MTKAPILFDDYYMILYTFNPCGESDQLIVHWNIAQKWLSEAKQKARSEASRQNISNFNF